MRRLILIILSIIGAAFLIPTAVMLGIFHQQTAGMIPVEGSIAAWEGDQPVIAYTVDGQEYRCRMNVSSSVHWPVGSPYRLMADPENPARATDYFLVLMGGIFGLVSVVLFATGVTVYLVIGRGERRREELLQYGLRARAVVTEVRENYAVRVNQRHPWVIVAACAHPATREDVTLRSHMVWNPAVKEGDAINVAFDPMDEKRYAMEIPEESR